MNHHILTLQKRILLFAVFVLTAAGTFAQEPNSAQVEKPVVERPQKTGTSVTDVKENGAGASVINNDRVTAVVTKDISLETQAYPSSLPIAETTNAEPLPKQASTSSGWEFSVAPYLFMTSLNGTIGARGRTAEVDMSFSDIFDHLKIGAMGTMQARKGRLVIVSDLVFAKLEEERNTPGGLYSDAELSVNMFIFTPEAGYNLYRGDGGSFDILGGVRIQSVKVDLDFEPGTLPGFDVTQRKTWASPIVGGQGILNLHPKFFLSTKFDIGGGLGADLTGQFYGGAGYRIKPRVSLIGGYRYLKTNYDDDSGFIFDASMSGLLLGAKFTF